MNYNWQKGLCQW